MLVNQLNREDYKEKTIEEVSKEFDKMLADYKQEVSNMSVEQLKDEEVRIVKIAEDWDNQLKDISYDLPASVAFRDAKQQYSRKTVGEYICDLLEKIECEFSYTLGYYELYEWWKNPKTTINYQALNSTLSTLGSSVKYRGPQQWLKILVINEYFKSLHQNYQMDNFFTILYGSCHSIVLDELNVKDPERANSQQSHAVEAEQGPIDVE